METLNQEIKSTIMENYELENRKSIKSNSNCLEFSNYEDSHARNIIKVFQSNILLQKNIRLLGTS